MPTQQKCRIVLMLLLPICLIFSGCSFSRSSKHSSKSSSSPCRWSSRSSKKGQNSVKTASDSYKDEIVALTVLYSKSGGNTQDFQHELSIVSCNHGIVDWENNAQIYISIGIGLKQSGMSEKAIKALPFLQTDNFIDHYSQILSGYYLLKNVS